MMSDSRAPVAASDIEQTRLALQQFETEHCSDSEQSLLIRDAEPADLATVLPPHVALVDFVKSAEPLYSGANPAEPLGLTRGSVRERYDAFVLTVAADHSIRIRAIPLGNAAEIDALARTLHASLADPEVSAIDSFRSASEFYRTVWKPLAPHVSEYGHIVVIPSETLNLVPWNVLPVGESTELLFDRHTISVTEFAQQLCLPVARQPVEPERLVVVGDLDYRTEVTQENVTPITEGISSAGTGKDPLSALSTGSGFDSPIVQLGAATRGGAFGEWEPLPASRDESETLLDLFATHRRGEARFLRGNDATPRQVAQSIRGATHLHFAIHAFYLADDSEVELVIDPRHSSLIGSSGDSGNLYSTSTIAVQNPFLLSGLVLSPSRNGSGGISGRIMTAEQIARMDLSGVQLVTLSACDTGRGETLNGEVAAGLRSAFHRAGVRCVVSSLWSVNDVTTSALMKDFYRNLWELNQSPATALRNAQRRLRDDLQTGRVVPQAWKTRGIDTKKKIIVDEKPVDWSSIAAWRHWAAFQVSGTP